MWLFYTLFSLKLKWSCPSKTLVATHNLPKEPEYKFEGKKCGTKQMLQDMEKKFNYYLSHRQQKTCEKVHYLPDKWDLSNDWEIYQGKSIQLTINKLYNSTIKGTFVFEKFLIILTPLTEEMYSWNWRARIKLCHNSINNNIFRLFYHVGLHNCIQFKHKYDQQLIQHMNWK